MDHGGLRSTPRLSGATLRPLYIVAIGKSRGLSPDASIYSVKSGYYAANLLCYNSTDQSRRGCRRRGSGGKTIKLKYLCPRCEFNWRSCHNPKRPNVTRDEGCKDFWPRGKEKPPDIGKLSTAWIDGVDLSGLKKGKRPRLEK